MSKKRSWRAHIGGAYLTHEDFPEPEILTIREAREEEVTPPGGKPEIKWVLYFEEIEKGLVLNKTNSKWLEKFTGTEYPVDWIGVRLEAYNDPSVVFNDTAGGIRLRKAPTPMPHRPVRIDEPSSIETEPAEIEVPY
jgi:hypothetical protein